MPLSSRLVGQKSKAFTHDVDARWIMAYAAGLGVVAADSSFGSFQKSKIRIADHELKQRHNAQMFMVELPCENGGRFRDLAIDSIGQSVFVLDEKPTIGVKILFAVDRIGAQFGRVSRRRG